MSRTSSLHGVDETHRTNMRETEHLKKKGFGGMEGVVDQARVQSFTVAVWTEWSSKAGCFDHSDAVSYYVPNYEFFEHLGNCQCLKQICSTCNYPLSYCCGNSTKSLASGACNVSKPSPISQVERVREFVCA